MVIVNGRTRFVLASAAKTVITALLITLVLFAVRRSAIPWVQYFSWLGNILTGDLGYSRSNSGPVAQSIMERLPATFELIVASFVIALALGSVLAFLYARSSTSMVRSVISWALLAAESVPVFWIALMLQMLITTRGWLPNCCLAGTDRFDLGDHLAHLILPAGILTLFQLRPVVKSILKVSAPIGGSTPVARRVSGLFLTFVQILPGVFAAVFLVELIFAWPGEGRLFFTALGQGDRPLVIGILLVTAMFVLILRFIAEIVRAPDDPLGAVSDVA